MSPSPLAHQDAGDTSTKKWASSGIITFLQHVTRAGYHEKKSTLFTPSSLEFPMYVYRKTRTSGGERCASPVRVVLLRDDSVFFLFDDVPRVSSVNSNTLFHFAMKYVGVCSRSRPLSVRHPPLLHSRDWKRISRPGGYTSPGPEAFGISHRGKCVHAVKR